MPGQPINKAVNLRQGRGIKGSLQQYAAEFFEPNPAEHRIKRERRRFKVPDTLFLFTESFYESDGSDPPSKGSLITSGVAEHVYYERCEMTLDTLANPAIPLDEMEKIPDKGGDFCHSLIEYRKWRPAVIHDSRAWTETEIIEVNGLSVCIPSLDYEHDGVKIAECIDPPKEDLDMSSLGPSLWASMRPTKPVMDLGVAIAELRDIPRMLKHSWTSIKALTTKFSAAKAILNSPLKSSKKVAEWVLAVQFGWLPLFSDLQRVLKLKGDVEKRLNFIKDNANKNLHRITPKKPWKEEVTEETIEEYESSENDSPLCSLNSDSWSQGQDPDSIPNRFKSSIKLRKTVVIGATGLFRYYWDGKIPHDDYLRARLTGIVLTERVAWEAFPWLWLVDWFSNAGKVLSNMKDHMDETTVAPIAYAQRYIIREYTWTCSNGFHTASVSRFFETKVRRKIDPFGLAASASLTSIQKVILGALALTRVRH